MDNNIIRLIQEMFKDIEIEMDIIFLLSQQIAVRQTKIERLTERINSLLGVENYDEE
jgi:hypothetical protein